MHSPLTSLLPVAALLIPDNLLLIIFGTFSFMSLLVGVVGFFMAVRAAKKKDAELKMAAWAFVGLAGLVFAGMSWAYFLIPILLSKL